MEVKYAFLATAAEFAAAPDGRLSLIGGDLDTIWGNDFPLVYPSLAVVLKLWLSPDEVGKQHTLGVALADAQDSVLVAVPPFPFTSAPNPRDPTKRAQSGVVAVLMGLPFPSPGEYHVTLTVDGQSVTALPLYAAMRDGEAE
jgi:hypothetical protein